MSGRWKSPSLWIPNSHTPGSLPFLVIAPVYAWPAVRADVRQENLPYPVVLFSPDGPVDALRGAWIRGWTAEFCPFAVDERLVALARSRTWDEGKAGG